MNMSKEEFVAIRNEMEALGYIKLRMPIEDGNSNTPGFETPWCKHVKDNLYRLENDLIFFDLSCGDIVEAMPDPNYPNGVLWTGKACLN